LKADLSKKKAQLKAALGMARTQLGLAGAAGMERLEEDLDSSESVLGFLGPEGGAAASLGLAAARAAGAARMDLGTTMNWLRAKVRAEDFCAPGQRRAVPGTDAINAYVLGPPRGTAQVRKMKPTGDQDYKLMADRVTLLGAVESLLSGDDTTETVPPGPFEQNYRVDLEQAAQDPFFRRRYGFPGDPLSDPIAEWRRIDHEWLVGGSAGSRSSSMPAHGVHEALHGFTNGRIIRADHGSTDQLDEEVDATARTSRSWKEFRDRVRFQGAFPADAQRTGKPLYVEYTIPL